MMEREARYTTERQFDVNQPTARELCQVDAAVNAIDRAAEALGDTVTRLEERLGRVLTEAKMQGEPLRESGPKAPPCALVGDLNRIAARLEAAGAQARNLLERLAL